MPLGELGKCLEELRVRPWPRLAGEIGHFGLYDSLIAGCASSVLDGIRLKSEDVPEPDPATIDAVATLRAKSALSADEAAFLTYFDSVQRVRHELMLACDA